MFLTLESTPGFTIDDMHGHIRQIVASGLFAAFTTPAAVAQHPEMPPGMTHEEHLTQTQRDGELKTRGAAAMGFDQDKTTHHFRLYDSGGAIEVVASDVTDEATVRLVRAHLREIADQFAGGDFAKPLATHGEMPPGSADDATAEARAYVQVRRDGNGRPSSYYTSDSEATDAIHEFLRYQIREHATGDLLTVVK